ncbi:hypothetical protein BAUCODRAFT_31590 [Baudoinia panamericana UAMH 10762]|uniref:Non-structural maintenance of chromosomes element 4 n=1 Tax=Baudoinia panamericana (strain UAMH 10762) TaxID=717646 RepID=M2MQZ1_BAUPA|nr:uncharacterized protein BAUCODRAFT_31590 [Baudoinia panamericana UAMH 10762]EMC99256.1 hypothetical protein BAUCODRAFT_31590 [Baudoinia panamericana UAMH 10762]
MARRNNRPSSALSSRYASATPASGNNSDQENQDPAANARPKGKARAMPPPPSRNSLPTPNSDDSIDHRGQKRKRIELRTDATQDDEEDDADSDGGRFKKYYEPNQDAESRRQLKRKSRALEREFNESRDELLRGRADALTTTINRANKIFETVKQTSDATVDSRLLVSVSDLAQKKTAHLVLGDSSAGVDVDEFLSKCITYMRNGGPASTQAEPGPSNSRRRRTRDPHDSDDEDATAGDAMDWEFFGRNACFPYISRPPVPTFLLGPLSVEKKQRTQTQRRAKQRKDTAGREARPEALSKDDLQQSDANALTAICTRIRRQLHNHIRQAEASIARAGFTKEDMATERGRAMLKKHRLATNGCVPLFDFVLNPRSFGQTVENLFYISFLIKEGSVGIAHDENGLPTLNASNPTSLEEKRERKISNHQAVFALDYSTWKELTHAFEISEPMIPHREDEQPTQLGQRGWYT